MNLLFEIADRDLIIIGLILTVILIIATLVFRYVNRNNRVRPISENERFDNDEPIVKPVNIDLTDEQKKAKEELERVFNQMSADLENQTPTMEEIDDFEREQEENAIISYKELMRQAGQNVEEPINEVTNIKNNIEEKYTEKTINEEKPISKGYQGFKNSDIISPIYGIQANSEKKQEKTFSNSKTRDIIANAYEKTSNNDETIQNMDFLNSLKEFRKNL